MKAFFAVLAVLCMMAGTAPRASAAPPSDVMEPYKAYRDALTAGDIPTARKRAKQAWMAAEQHLGDSKMTGDLAFNYGAVVEDGKAERDQIDAIERSMDLVADYGEIAPTVYLERGVKLFLVMNRADRKRSVEGTARKLVRYAEKNGQTDSTFYAEALTVLAGKQAARGDNERAKAFADKAMAVFERADDGIVSTYPLQASLYRGYGYEGEDNHLQAALSYQKVMEATDGLDPAEFDIVGTTLGRWIYMRSALRSAGNLDEAEEAGLCQCWPYDKPRNEEVQPINRVPPVMPREAQQSGYVVVEFDLDDAGKPINERVITAWPDYFETPALKSLRKWEYTPRVAGQTDSDRTDIVTTITFQLADTNGKIIW